MALALIDGRSKFETVLPSMRRQPRVSSTRGRTTRLPEWAGAVADAVLQRHFHVEAACRTAIRPCAQWRECRRHGFSILRGRHEHAMTLTRRGGFKQRRPACRRVTRIQLAVVGRFPNEFELENLSSCFTPRVGAA